jgi:hypothetical protein
MAVTMAETRFAILFADGSMNVLRKDTTFDAAARELAMLRNEEGAMLAEIEIDILTGYASQENRSCPVCGAAHDEEVAHG